MKPSFIVVNSLDPKLITKSVMDEYIKSNALAEDIDTLSNIIEYPYMFDALKELRNMSVTHRKCLKAKAVDITMSGWKVIPTGKNSDPNNKKILEELLEDPDAIDSLCNSEEDKQTYQFGAVEILKNNKGDVKGFKHLRASTIRMCGVENPGEQAGEKAIQRIGAKTVYYKVCGKRSDEILNAKTGHWDPNTSEEDQATEILWRNGPGPDSDYYGEPEYLAATITILSDYKLREFNYNSFRANKIPNYFIMISGSFDPGEDDEDDDGNIRSQFEMDMETALGDVSNKPGSALVYTMPTTNPDGGNDINIHVEKLSDEITDASFENLRRSNQDEILMAHEVPPSRLNITVDGPLAGNVDVVRNQNYGDKTIKPDQRRLESSLNRLIVQGIMGIKDCLISCISLDTRDLVSDLKNAFDMVQNGAMKPLELRKNFADVFGIEDVESDKINYPELDQFFMAAKPINGSELTGGIVPVDGTQSVSPEADAILKSMEDKIYELITS